MKSQKEKAIALCRVSTDEQLKNNSMNRQQEAVTKIAERYNLEIVKTWKMSISSKDGKNLKRTDIKEMLGFCQKNKGVKYLLVDEPDRFMRSEKERCYYETLFNMLGVRILYSNESFNGNNFVSEMQKSMMFLAAQSSNEERARKAKAGHEKAIRDGRYTFVPPLGYKRGSVCGIPEIDPVIGPLLRSQLIRIANNLATPTVALQDYNHSVELAGLNKAPLKMDKWRAICTNPFYCGIIELHKIVDASNPNGLHEKLISKEQHERILDVFNGSPKNQKGPNTAGNPLYPFNQMVTHVGCPCNRSKYNTFVGVTVKNNQGKEYEKYRCRGCYMTLTRNEMRERLKDVVSSIELTKSGYRALRDALTNVFEMEEGDITSRQTQLYSQRANAKKEAERVMNAFVDARERTIRDSLEEKHKELIARIKKYEEEINDLGNFEALENQRFCDYAINFINNLVRNVLNLPPKEMQLCKQLLFPDGFYVDEDRNVYTTKISPIYRLKSIKKDSDESSDSPVVRAKRL